MIWNLNVFAQTNTQKKAPILTESALILPDEFKENFPYKIDVRIYVRGNYDDRQLITVVPLQLGERITGRVEYDSTTGKINVYLQRNLVATKMAQNWNELLPKISYGYGAKFTPKEIGAIDFSFVPRFFSSMAAEYEVFNKYDSEWGVGVKVYHSRK